MSKIITFGVFDYFHIGHLRLFKQCKEYADYLIVAVQNGNYISKFKPESKTLYSTHDRVEIIESLRCVDEVIVYDVLCVECIESIEFDILALGEDHLGGRFEEVEKWCKSHGKKVVRLKRTVGISSSQIKGEVVYDLK